MPSRDRLRILIDAPRWFLLAVLFWAPWAYGSTRPWTVVLLGWLMLGLVVVWGATFILRRMSPHVHPVLLGATIVLLVQGWGMIGNSDSYYDGSELIYSPIHSVFPALPRVVNLDEALSAMVRYTGLLGIMCFVCDLVQRPTWRNRLWWTIGLAGTSIVFFGLFRKILGVDLTSTYDPKLSGATSFALFFYHGNAGAFINLVLPFIWCAAVRAWRGSTANFERAVWIPALIMSIAAVVVTASKAAIGVMPILLAVLAGWELRYQFKRGTQLPRKVLLVYGVLILFGAAAAVAFGWTSAAKRWSEMLADPVSYSERLRVYAVCLRVLPDSGFWGFGPGNFVVSFPHYTRMEDAIPGLWRWPHQDYFQTIIEWGWFGAAIWAIIFFGGMVIAGRTLAKGALSSADHMLVLAALLALVGIALHGMIDFPLQVASLQLYTAVCLGLAWGSRQFASGRILKRVVPAEAAVASVPNPRQGTL